VGSFEAQKASHERQLEEREQLIKQTARRHNIRGFDLEIGDDQVQEFMEKISKMAKDQNAAFERARRETQQELQEAQSVLNRINEQKSALNQRKESSRSTITTNERRIDAQQTEMNQIDIDEGGKANLESAIEDVQGRLEAAKSEFDAADWEKVVSESENNLQSLDISKEKLDAELVEGTKRAGDTARLDFLRKELKDRERSLQTMTGAHGDKINKIVGSDWSVASLETDFQRALGDSKSRVTDAERQRDGVSRELEQLNFRLNTCRTDIKRKRQEITRAEQTVRKLLEDGDEMTDYPNRLAEMESTTELARSDASKYAATLEYFNSALETAKKHNVCRMCRRGFRDDSKGFDNLIKFLEKEIKRASSEEEENDMQAAEEELKALREAQPNYDAWERLTQTEMPALEADESKLTSRYEELVAEVETHDQVVSEREDEKRDIESLTKTIQNIVKYHNDIGGFERQIAELSSKQSQSGSARGLEVIQDELKSVNERSRLAKASLNKSVGDRDRAKGAINAMELELRDVQSRLSNAVYQLKEKVSLQKQIDELKTTITEQREAIRSIDQELQSRVPELSQAQTRYDDIARRGAEKDRQLQEQTSALNNSLNKLQVASREIDNYIGRGGPDQLARAKSAIDRQRQEISEIEQKMNEITKEVKQIESQLRNVEETKRSICDNQDYRRDKRAVDAIATEIEELESHNVEAERDEWDRQQNHWQQAMWKLAADQKGHFQALGKMDEQFRAMSEDYNTNYKDAAYRYKEAHIKVETTKAAVEDLGRYAGALDKAIMKYHALKMEEINRIIDELWRRTYQGTDIDTILIRSDSEAAKGNKSYNYRVCMIKQDAEMDMRGRCSAGQKVLASIIIRLALAECFGVNCGLIALDEPTTNLDRDNIRALAESLGEIIRLRRQQSNFQLIVITHDEEFLRFMQCADFADYYYRVSRGQDQKSQIERQQIANVSLDRTPGALKLTPVE